MNKSHQTTRKMNGSLSIQGVETKSVVLHAHIRGHESPEGFRTHGGHGSHMLLCSVRRPSFLASLS